jgi:hypothetical protein
MTGDGEKLTFFLFDDIASMNVCHSCPAPPVSRKEGKADAKAYVTKKHDQRSMVNDL